MFFVMATIASAGSFFNTLSFSTTKKSLFTYRKIKGVRNNVFPKHTPNMCMCMYVEREGGRRVFRHYYTPPPPNAL